MAQVAGWPRVAVVGAGAVGGYFGGMLAQDLLRGKRTEIDFLNGYIAKRDRELGVPTPVNQALWTLVKLTEAAE